MTNNELMHLTACLSQVSQMKLPGSLILAKNFKKTKKKAEALFELFDQIRNKYCKLSKETESGYKLKDEFEGEEKNANYEDFDAGEKQSEYEKKLKEATEAVVDIKLDTIQLSREVQDGDKTKTVEEIISFELQVPAVLLEPLLDVIYI